MRTMELLYNGLLSAGKVWLMGDNCVLADLLHPQHFKLHLLNLITSFGQILLDLKTCTCLLLAA